MKLYEVSYRVVTSSLTPLFRKEIVILARDEEHAKKIAQKRNKTKYDFLIEEVPIEKGALFKCDSMEVL